MSFWCAWPPVITTVLAFFRSQIGERGSMQCLRVCAAAEADTGQMPAVLALHPLTGGGIEKVQRLGLGRNEDGVAGFCAKPLTQ